MRNFQQTRNILLSETTAFLVAVILSFGIFIPWFSLYGDDWIYLYAYHLQGAPFYIDFVAPDRPFSAWIYILTSSLFKETYWLYHVFLAALRWISAVMFFKVLVQIWPKHSEKAFWAALLFAVYPGFLQQPISLQFILHFAVLDLFLFSIWGMNRSISIKEKYWFYTLLALAGSSGIFSLEYYFGLEFLRPVIIWMVLPLANENISKKIFQVFRIWVPYLILLTGFLFWRIFLFDFKHYEPELLNELMQSPLETLKNLPVTILNHEKTVLYDAWRQIIRFPDNKADYLLYFGIFLLAFILVLIFVRLHYGKKSTPKDERNDFKNSWEIQAIILGGISLLVGGIPIWIVGLPLSLSFPWDRSTLPFMVGSALILTSFIFLFIQRRFHRYFLAIIFALSTGFHYQNALVYKEEAEMLRTYFWQLSWRVPDLEKGTIVLADAIPLYRFSDNGLTPILNWMYAPDLRDTEVPYKLFELTGRLAEGMPLLEEGVEISHPYRRIKFSGNTSNSLVLYYSPGSCLRVLDSSDADAPGLPDNIRSALPLSNLDRILFNSTNQKVPPSIVGREPEHDWCYYFEQADLAKQALNWDKIIAIWDEAVDNGFVPGEPIEYFPFIEAFAHKGNITMALQLSGEVFEDELYNDSLCSLWNSITEDLAFSKIEHSEVFLFMEQLGCSQ